MSRGRHRRWRTGVLLYALGWLAALVVGVSLADGWWRLAVAIAFTLIAPRWDDLRESYDDYRRQWRLANER